MGLTHSDQRPKANALTKESLQEKSSLKTNIKGQVRRLMTREQQPMEFTDFGNLEPSGWKINMERSQKIGGGNNGKDVPRENCSFLN